jgi:hypothetical protein
VCVSGERDEWRGEGVRGCEVKEEGEGNRMRGRDDVRVSPQE